MIEETTLEPVVADTDDLTAHYAAKADIVRAHVTGQPIRALCGKVWTPSRDPAGAPVCPVCEAELRRVAMRSRAPLN